MTKAPTTVRLYYVHDPMCSWCWGYRPTWEAIKAALPSDIEVVYVVGGLAPDSDSPMPETMAAGLQSTWHRIEAMLGTPFNHAFWTENTPRRSTYPACRSVIAAEAIAGKGVEMIVAVQQGYYLHAKNPSNLSVLSDMANSIGVDGDRLLEWMRVPEHEQRFQQELAFAHSLPISGFPSLVLEVDGLRYPIALDYQVPQVALDDIKRVRADY
jgi:putative protein-disulfide isomerase